MEGKIKNFEALLGAAKDNSAEAQLRKWALEIGEAGLAAIDTKTAIQKNVSLRDKTLLIAGKEIDLELVRRVVVIGIGKCAIEACRELETILGERLEGGIVLDVREGVMEKLKVFTGTHPFPSQQNVEATREIISLLEELKDNDLAIFVISGGGSTLLCQPQNINYSQESLLLRHLFDAGAGITEINILRKHLSLARGGYLAKYAYPARVVSLVFSDVPGGDLEFIASGPTALDTTTISDAKKLFDKYKLEERCGITGEAFIETPKEEKYFTNVRNIIIVSNEIALEAMRKIAESFGFRVAVDSIGLNGEASERGAMMAREIAAAGPGSAILWGGESVVTMKNGGKGGRNLEIALSALGFIGDLQIVVSLASDGRDNTDFAGGIADTLTKGHITQLKLELGEFLKSHSSYSFFSQTGDYLLTGDTGSNVADLAIALYLPVKV